MQVLLGKSSLHTCNMSQRSDINLLASLFIDTASLIPTTLLLHLYAARLGPVLLLPTKPCPCSSCRGIASTPRASPEPHPPPHPLPCKRCPESRTPCDYHRFPHWWKQWQETLIDDLFHSMAANVGQNSSVLNTCICKALWATCSFVKEESLY